MYGSWTYFPLAYLQLWRTVGTMLETSCMIVTHLLSLLHKCIKSKPPSKSSIVSSLSSSLSVTGCNWLQSCWYFFKNVSISCHYHCNLCVRGWWKISIVSEAELPWGSCNIGCTYSVPISCASAYPSSTERWGCCESVGWCWIKGISRQRWETVAPPRHSNRLGLQNAA